MAVYTDYLKWTQLTALARKLAIINSEEELDRKLLYLVEDYRDGIQCRIVPHRNTSMGRVALAQDETIQVEWSRRSQRLSVLSPREEGKKWSVRYDGPKDTGNPLFRVLAATSPTIDPLAHMTLRLNAVGKEKDVTKWMDTLRIQTLLGNAKPENELPKIAKAQLGLVSTSHYIRAFA